eukprot:m.1280 g.1280  ORF g.1280 m.1280 type:complete len:54 (-) comp480_c0_seq1:315-476(-)
MYLSVCGPSDGRWVVRKTDLCAWGRKSGATLADRLRPLCVLMGVGAGVLDVDV